MGKETGSIKYLKERGIENIIVFQSKTKRVWLSDVMTDYNVDLADVSKQRKLLIDFMDSLNRTDITLIEISDFDAVADHYIEMNL